MGTNGYNKLIQWWSRPEDAASSCCSVCKRPEIVVFCQCIQQIFCCRCSCWHSNWWTFIICRCLTNCPTKLFSFVFSFLTFCLRSRRLRWWWITWIISFSNIKLLFISVNIVRSHGRFLCVWTCICTVVSQEKKQLYHSALQIRRQNIVTGRLIMILWSIVRG